MGILTIEFWGIVLLTVISVNIVHLNRSKQFIIFMGSCSFCLLCSWKAFILLFLFALVSYMVANNIGKLPHIKRRKVLCIYIGVSIALLVFFKYMNFFIFEIGRMFGYSWNFINLVVPLGISFYVLSAIGYIVDVYLEKSEAEHDLLSHLIYFLYFPKLSSGPIERGNIFFEKIKKLESVNREKVYEGLQIILVGLIKKVVIADRMGVCVDAIFLYPEKYSALSLVFGMLAYSIQIYCDFSGYTDVAIGISKLMGISLAQNFDLPYCANSPGDFWRRWHISLSTWFRDYVYIPLGGNRNGKKIYRNLFVTMLLSGIWHGANWTYWIWGICHGLAQCVHKFVLNRKKKMNKNGMNVFLNFIFITCMWTIFRADSLADAVVIFKGVVTLKPGIQYYYSFLPVYLFVVLGFHIYEYIIFDKHFAYITFDMSKTYHYVIILAEVICLLSFGYFGNTAFIYNQF